MTQPVRARQAKGRGAAARTAPLAVLPAPAQPAVAQSREPATVAGRALLADRVRGFEDDAKNRGLPSRGAAAEVNRAMLVEDWTERILAIEAEAAAAAIWERLEAQPGFNEELAQGEAQIAAGLSMPLREASASPALDVKRLIVGAHDAICDNRVHGPERPSFGWDCERAGRRIFDVYTDQVADWSALDARLRGGE
jgi:hypothetical protein